MGTQLGTRVAVTCQGPAEGDTHTHTEHSTKHSTTYWFVGKRRKTKLQRLHVILSRFLHWPFQVSIGQEGRSGQSLELDGWDGRLDGSSSGVLLAWLDWSFHIWSQVRNLGEDKKRARRAWDVRGRMGIFIERVSTAVDLCWVVDFHFDYLDLLCCCVIASCCHGIDGWVSSPWSFCAVSWAQLSLCWLPSWSRRAVVTVEPVNTTINPK